MSQRSQVANSGSSPIEACSAACAAPGTSRWPRPRPRPARRRARSTTPPWSSASARAGRAAPRRAPRRERQPAQEATHLVVTSTVPNDSRDPGPPLRALAADGCRTRLTDCACVDHPGSPRTTCATRASRSSSVTTPGLALVHVDRAGVHLRVRDAASTVPSTRPVAPRRPRPTSPPPRSGCRRGRRRSASGPEPAARAAAAAAAASTSSSSRPRARRARTSAGRPRSAAAPRRPRTGAAPARSGLSGSKTVASTGSPNSASGWCTR